MRKNKVKIPFEKGKGITDFDPLNKLDTSFENIEKAKKVIINSLNNKMNRFKINRLVALVLPLGLLLIVLSAVFLTKVPMVLLIFVGIFIMLVFPFYICTKWSRLSKAVKSTADRIQKKTKNKLICTPIYKKKIRRMAESTRSFRVLSYFVVKVNVPKSPEFYERTEINNMNVNFLKNNGEQMDFADGTFTKKENSKLENVERRKLSENIPLKLDYETNPANEKDDFGNEKEPKAFIHDVKINHFDGKKFNQVENVGEGENEIKHNIMVDMVQVEKKN